jgi:hypothetical protein
MSYAPEETLAGIDMRDFRVQIRSGNEGTDAAGHDRVA